MSNTFYTGHSMSGKFTSMFGAGRCVRRKNVIMSTPIDDDKKEEETTYASIPDLEKTIESKPELEELSNKLSNIRIRKDKKKRVVFKPHSK